MISKKEKAELEEALRKFEKEEAKRWSEIHVPLRLEDALARLTKVELTRLAKNLDLSKVSQLKKQELIEVLQRRIPERVNEIFLTFDQERYSIVKRIVLSNGHTFTFDLNEDQLHYFLICGIIFPGTVDGRRAVVMPQEIMMVFEQIINKDEYLTRIRRNTEWLRLTYGMLYYYGTLSFHQIEAMLEKYTGEKIAWRDYHPLLKEAEIYSGDVWRSKIGYSYYRVIDPHKVQREHQARPSLDYYPFSKEQLLRAGATDYVERNLAYRDLVIFIMKNYEITKEEADRLVDECAWETNLDAPLQKIVELLQSELEFNSKEFLEKLVSKVVLLMNSTRQWALKGHSPEELSTREKKNVTPPKRSEVIDFKTKQKVGRNDPCPCGSGKKFKKCCDQ